MNAELRFETQVTDSKITGYDVYQIEDNKHIGQIRTLPNVENTAILVEISDCWLRENLKLSAYKQINALCFTYEFEIDGDADDFGIWVYVNKDDYEFMDSVSTPTVEKMGEILLLISKHNGIKNEC